jgi:hypothetical protein
MGGRGMRFTFAANFMFAAQPGGRYPGVVHRFDPMREADLYPPVKRFLERQGYAVKGEIGACDVVALRGDEAPVIVELKRGLSLELLLQGIDRQALTDAVYLAVPKPKRKGIAGALALCRRLGLGLLLVTSRGVEPVLDPAPYRPRRDARRKATLLKEFHRRMGDTEAGGSAARPRMTAYRQDALRLAAFIAADGTARVAATRAATGVERAGPILLDDVYGWFRRVERGTYALTPKGVAALATYAGALSAMAAQAREPAAEV